MNNNANPQQIAPSGSASGSSSQTAWSVPWKTRSKIWPHFNACMWDDAQKPSKAKCCYNNCGSEFYCKDGTTGSMGLHLKQDHGFDGHYEPPGSPSHTRDTTIQVSDYLFQSQIRNDFSLCIRSNKCPF